MRYSPLVVTFARDTDRLLLLSVGMKSARRSGNSPPQEWPGRQWATLGPACNRDRNPLHCPDLDLVPTRLAAGIHPFTFGIGIAVRDKLLAVVDQANGHGRTRGIANPDDDPVLRDVDVSLEIVGRRRWNAQEYKNHYDLPIHSAPSAQGALDFVSWTVCASRIRSGMAVGRRR